uniref:Uncharacterized protein n=1 Tax=Neobodo designis TaxID=312471 RepID=A0A7S1L3I6_NEODS
MDAASGDVVALIASVAFALVCAVGLVRAGLAGFLGVAFGALSASVVLSVAVSLVATNLTSAAIASDAGVGGSGIGLVVARLPVVRALLLALSLPSLSSIALLGTLLVVAYYARAIAALGAEAELLFSHFAAVGHRASTSTAPAE